MLALARRHPRLAAIVVGAMLVFGVSSVRVLTSGVPTVSNGLNSGALRGSPSPGTDSSEWEVPSATPFAAG